MPEFADAGGLPALLNCLTSVLELDCPTVTGATLGENIRNAKVEDADVIRSWQSGGHRGALAV